MKVITLKFKREEDFEVFRAEIKQDIGDFPHTGSIEKEEEDLLEVVIDTFDDIDQE